MNRFDRNTFESVEFLLESAETPKIKAGGSSSSNILNRYFSAFSQDLSLLATRANVLAARSSRVESGMSAQAGALQSLYSSLSTRVDTASAYTMVLADMHDTYYIDTGASTTVDINYTFGQTTLAELSSIDLLVQTDVYGSKYVSPEVVWQYSTSNASSISTMSILDFIPDPDGIFMIREDQTWIRSKLAGQTKGYARLKAPLQFRGLTPNVLELYPFPAFGMTLRKASYRKAADPEDTWYHLDLSYLPNYEGVNQTVEKVGPVRIFLPNEAISELVFEFDVSNTDVWGIKKLKIYHKEYASVGTITVKDPFSRTIGDISLRGKDPATLSTFPVTKVTNEATITLSSTNSAETPVLTGVIMDVS